MKKFLLPLIAACLMFACSDSGNDANKPYVGNKYTDLNAETGLNEIMAFYTSDNLYFVWLSDTDYKTDNEHVTVLLYEKDEDGNIVIIDQLPIDTETTDRYAYHSLQYEKDGQWRFPEHFVRYSGEGEDLEVKKLYIVDAEKRRIIETDPEPGMKIYFYEP